MAVNVSYCAPSTSSIIDEFYLELHVIFAIIYFSCFTRQAVKGQLIRGRSCLRTIICIRIQYVLETDAMFLNVNQNSILNLNQSKAIHRVTRFRSRPPRLRNSFSKYITERNNEINLRFQYCQMDFHTWFSSLSYARIFSKGKDQSTIIDLKTEIK